MKRSFEREANLSAFRCDLATLEAFIAELSAEYYPDLPRISIDIKLPGEDVQFDSFDEVKAFKAFSASITNLSVSIGSSTDVKSRSIYLNSRIFSRPYIRVGSLSEPWCAGIVEKTKRFANNNRAWYWFIRPWIVYLLFFISMMIATQSGISMILLKQIPSKKSALEFMTLLIFCGITGFLFIAYKKIFSPIVLIIRSEENWVKKHSTELTVGAAIVAAIAAIYSALIK